MQLTKYSANGNDFVIFHTFIKKERSELARKLCDRQNGIGADGLIVIVPHNEYDFEWQFYNADGSEAEMCGNGSRAAAHYAYSNELAPEKMRFLTLAGVIEAHVEGDVVESELTPPKILRQDIEHNGTIWWKIDTGVPHLVALLESIEIFDIKTARALRYEHNANVNIATIDTKGSLHVRTYERGVEDETLACGTGMAAAFYRALRERRVQEAVRVYPKSGDKLYLRFQNETIFFKGAVTPVFTTTIAV